MKYLFPIVFSLLCSIYILESCQKYQDPPPIDDPNIDKRKYCNDIEAVNYNWGFPGKPDSSLCIFPSSTFEGIYNVFDTIYSRDDSFISAAFISPVEITKLAKQSISIKGLCTQDITLLCDRYLNVLTDTVGNTKYTVCGNDSLIYTGTKMSIDTADFSVKVQEASNSYIYHKLIFVKQ